MSKLNHLDSCFSQTAIQRDMQTGKEDADLLGVRHRQVFADDFSLLTTPMAVASGNSWLWIVASLLLSSSSSSPFLHPVLHALLFLSIFVPLFSLIHTLSFPPFSSLSPCDCYDCCAFLCQGLQEEWVSTCQRAQVCTVDTGCWGEEEDACVQGGLQSKAPDQPQGNDAANDTSIRPEKCTKTSS